MVRICAVFFFTKSDFAYITWTTSTRLTILGKIIALLPFKIVHFLENVQRELTHARLFQRELTHVEYFSA